MANVPITPAGLSAARAEALRNRQVGEHNEAALKNEAVTTGAGALRKAADSDSVTREARLQDGLDLHSKTAEARSPQDAHSPQTGDAPAQGAGSSPDSSPKPGVSPERSAPKGPEFEQGTAGSAVLNGGSASSLEEASAKAWATVADTSLWRKAGLTEKDLNGINATANEYAKGMVGGDTSHPSFAEAQHLGSAHALLAWTEATIEKRLASGDTDPEKMAATQQLNSGASSYMHARTQILTRGASANPAAQFASGGAGWSLNPAGAKSQQSAAAPQGGGAAAGPNNPSPSAAGSPAGQPPPAGPPAGRSQLEDLQHAQAMQADQNQARTIYMQMMMDAQKEQANRWKIIQDMMAAVWQIQQSVFLNRMNTMQNSINTWHRIILQERDK